MSRVPLADLKTGGTVTENTAFEDAKPSDPVEAQKYGTQYDHRDMVRMGKLQQLRRDFHFFSIFGYAVILGCTWEFALITGVFSLNNGGPAGAIWIFLVVCFGMFFVMLSMAEMASIAPTAGGQYHWVSEFSPAKYQKILSYSVGWLCVLGWQSAMVLVSYSAAQQFEALIALSDMSYVIQGWHGALLTMAATLFAIAFNTFLIRKLPLIEGIVMVLHVFGFFAVIIVLWVMGPRGEAKVVLTDFQDNSGWGSIGLAVLIGILGPVITLIGSDSSCHLSEELRDAAWILPRAMCATAIVNYIMGFVMTVTLMFTLGNLDEILESPTGQPYVAVLQNATGSQGATITLTLVVAIMMMFCGVNLVTTSSRQLFAFARDGGLPFSHFLAYVRPGWDIPLNAVTVTMCFTVLLSLIIIGSNTAFTIITTLSETGLISSYLIAIGCIISKRLRGEPFPKSRFTLGKAGMAVNIIACCFLSLIWVLMFFPPAPKPDSAGMNWSVLIYSCVIIFMFIYYYFKGKHTYTGPVESITKDM